MVVATTSGYFVTIVGPYLADSKNNDASILSYMLKTTVEGIRNWVHEDDIFIVDTGFRDSLSLLEDIGIKAEMPSFMLSSIIAVGCLLSIVTPLPYPSDHNG